MSALAELVSQLQRSDTPAEAEKSRWRLEARVLPNQVLGPCAPRMVRLLVSGMDAASPYGVRESWEVLAQAAAGCVGPTAAEPEVVAATRAELEAAVSRAINRVAIVRPTDDVDHLAVDLLDASLGEGGRARDHAIHEALVRFGNRGQDEARHVAIIVGDGSGT